MANQDALAYRNRIKTGSLSFYFATLFLTKRERLGIYWLYAWCRHCDDVIDGLNHDAAKQLLALQKLRDDTNAAYAGNPTSSEIAFVGVAQLARDYKVPHYYFLQMLAGMEMDVKGHSYADWSDLRLYCYRVASTVGLMSCHVLGVKSVVALVHAEAMGLAMQLVNIARDVGDDARMKRCYIPNSFLQDSATSSSAVIDSMSDANQPATSDVVDAVARLLNLAEHHYAKGMRGLKFLPWRAAIAVATARFVYGAIGDKVRKRGQFAWRERVWISNGRKILLLARAFIPVIRTVPYRSLNRGTVLGRDSLQHIRRCEDGNYSLAIENHKGA